MHGIRGRMPGSHSPHSSWRLTGAPDEGEAAAEEQRAPCAPCSWHSWEPAAAGSSISPGGIRGTGAAQWGGTPGLRCSSAALSSHSEKTPERQARNNFQHREICPKRRDRCQEWESGRWNGQCWVNDGFHDLKGLFQSKWFRDSLNCGPNIPSLQQSPGHSSARAPLPPSLWAHAPMGKRAGCGCSSPGTPKWGFRTGEQNKGMIYSINAPCGGAAPSPELWAQESSLGLGAD